jgi:ribosome-binding protein aMBF1 (putative translation factor)
MITGRQVRAARALLNWKQEMLAEKALVALTALKRMESERGLPVQESTRDQVRRLRSRSRCHALERDTISAGATCGTHARLNAGV